MVSHGLSHYKLNTRVNVQGWASLNVCYSCSITKTGASGAPMKYVLSIGMAFLCPAVNDPKH